MQLALYSSIIIVIIIYLLKRHYRNTSKIELNHLQADRFTTQNLPFVYQSEYYSLAWGQREQKGFYIDPQGGKYHYKQPKDWRFYISETNNHRHVDNTNGECYVNADGLKFLYMKPDIGNFMLRTAEAQNHKWQEKGNKGFYKDNNGVKHIFARLTDKRFYIPANKASVWGYEMDGRIAPNDLFENLKNSIEKRSLFKFMRRTTPITQTMIDNLLTSKTVEGYGHCCTDSRILSNSLFVYDSEIDLYRRILLNSYGAIEMVNQSIYTKQIIQDLGIVRH